MKECLRNRGKAAKRKGKKNGSSSSPKRPRKITPKDKLLRRYPVRVQDFTVEDPAGIDQHKKAITKELKKAKPRDSVLLPLMQSTYQERRMFVESDASAASEILANYPALCRPAVVSPWSLQGSQYPISLCDNICMQIEQEMGLIVGQKEIRNTFEHNWTTVVPGVLKYGSKSKKKTVVSILSALRESGNVVLF